MNAGSHPFLLDCRGQVLDASPGNAHVMGILNVTPDSFSDGGLFLDPDAAVRHGIAMLDQGARIIDVGGASSRPRGGTYGTGATDVDTRSEIERVVPVIRGLRRERPEALLSIDTVHAVVAAAALDAGASIVNDVTGLRHDPDLARVTAESGAALILMHSVGDWGALVHESEYDDVTTEVTASLARAIEEATRSGVASVAVDPGFGFGKTPMDNLRLIARIDALLSLDRPVLVGVSRKSTIGITLGSRDRPAPVADRLYGSLGAAALAVARGASLVRTHDVHETASMLRVVTAVMEAGR